MTEFNRDGADNNAAPAQPQGSLRDRLIAQHGPAVGEALLEIELNARKKNAERLRELRTKLLEINTQIEARLQANAEALIPFTQRMEASYAVWLRDCEARDAKMARDQGSLIDVRNSAAALIREISQPPAHFARMVSQWSRPPDYTGPEVPREFENKTVVQVHPNWAPADPNHSPAPREFWNTPQQKGPGRG